MEAFAAYGHAIASLALYALIAGVLSALVGIRKGAKGMAPGALFAADYDDPSYRLERAFMNTAEALPWFATIIVAAMLAGVWPLWVNVVASLALTVRVIYTWCYIQKIGAAYGGVRTILTILASLPLYATALLTAWVLIF